MSGLAKLSHEASTTGLAGAGGISPQTPLIVAAKRTAWGRVGGLHSGKSAADLAAVALAGLIDAPELKGAIGRLEVQDVILGNAVGAGGNVARLAALRAGFDARVPGVTVDAQCGSGLEAVISGCRAVLSGELDVVIAGGVESISTAPQRAYIQPDGGLRPFQRAQFAPIPLIDPDLGPAADALAATWGITRSEQDAYAGQSYYRAAQAQEVGIFAPEIVPVDVGAKEQDETIRHSMTESLLQRFPGLWGSVSAGNSCQDADGAAVVLIVSARRAAQLHRELSEHGSPGLGAVLAYQAGARVGVAPEHPGLGAGEALNALPGWATSKPSQRRVEISEAFASQIIACARRAGVPLKEINYDGGGLAWGHPYGASGAVVVMRLLSQLRRSAQTVRTGGELKDLVAAISVAGGLGLAAHFTRVDLADLG